MPKLLSAFAGALFICLTMIPQAHGAYVLIRNNPGGIIKTFISKYKAIAARKEQVVIDGYCNSACTLVLSYVPLSRVCATEYAQFGFHSAYYSDNETGENLGFAKKATAAMWASYPSKVRVLLRNKGYHGQEHPDLVYIEGAELHSLVSICKKESRL